VMVARLAGRGPRPSRRWVLNDLGEGTVEVGNQDYLGWLYSCDRRFFPGVGDLVGFLNHPSP
jgi:hypothetical protein